MKIAILGAGFTGLTAGLRLSQKGHEIVIFEKDENVGGLAIGFQKKNWRWSLEKAYHHWFTNDDQILNLARELNYPVLIKRPKTKIFIKNQILDFDSVSSLLNFPFFNFLDKVRFALFSVFLKITNNYLQFENKLALTWIRKYFGKKITNLIWEPLFSAKFNKYKENISLVWFWARIKKRTPKLAYPSGGFKNFAEKIAKEIENNHGQILLNTEVVNLSEKDEKVIILTKNNNYIFDKVIVSLPSFIFTKISNQLPKKYMKKLISIDHLHALNLILILRKPFLKNTYWLNITDTSFPFLVLVEHTNFIDKQNYGKEHILYIGNYLTKDHPYLTMSKAKLQKIFVKHLKKINPDIQKIIKESYLFSAPFAQPIVSKNYHKKMPTFKTPLRNVYLANLDMTYPWDRGTNYAVELGEKVAKLTND
ncbi:FAD-dependent oxidoreductase [Candidatus Daviesbacteria bacterium]|nr:FAD-dependent oxidoreductase [Candidatus Daviesbacteria bacterium]